MKTRLLHVFSFAALLFVGLSAHAQSQSRLNIGQDAKPTSVSSKKPVTSLVVNGNVPKEINVNKNSAVTNFYRDLLLTKNTSSKNEAKVTFTSETIAEDKLFVNDNVSVSNIYPNPANDYAHLDYRIKSGAKAKVSFLNLLGGTVADFDLDSFDNRLNVETRKWDNGIYFYQLLIDGKKVATKKLLVRHN
ncbi:T9SS type A sorting domain-containing protein [Jiulongibacter sp. NS-SX5]|uniref:T9SS type A sorting domain-containing protein n=1 Tax=Jiulongibacter sp. NS-SX5 TaxID=3463854 RepID=UPI0040598F50